MNRYITSLLITLLLSSCSLINDEQDDAPVDVDSEEIMLSFHVSSPGLELQSRVDNAGHEETESDYMAFENGVDLNDVAIYIFAKVVGSEDSEDSEKLVGEFTPFTKANSKYTVDDMSIVDGTGIYTINVRFMKNDFDTKLGLANTDNPHISFRVLMLTSCTLQGTGGSMSTYKWNMSTLADQTYSNIIGRLSDKSRYNYQMEYIYDRKTADDSAMPSVAEIYPNRGKIYDLNGKDSGNGRQYMPMFGTNTFTARYADLVASSPTNRVYLGSLDLLRSVAKIRVADNISTKNADGYPKVVSASIIGDQESIAILPYNAENYVNGQQVHNPNPAVPGSNVTTEFKLGYVPENWPIIPAVEHSGKVFVGYCPEQTIHPLSSETRYPIIKVTVALGKDAEGNDMLEDYEVPMAGYNGSSFQGTFGEYLLRNHIYTLSVNGVNTGTLSLNVAVNDWKVIEYEYEY